MNERGFFVAKNQKKGGIVFNIKAFPALPPIERKPDGTLPRMTPQQRQKAVRLIRSVCYNYDSGDCLLLDDGEGCACVQSISYSVNCKYFRRVLLDTPQVNR